MASDVKSELLFKAALLCAVDPFGLGAVLRAQGRYGADTWLAALRGVLPHETPWRRMPSQVPDARLFGGLDIGATLAAGRPVVERGLLAETDGGFLLIPQAERLSPEAAARLTAVKDAGEIRVERDGRTMHAPAQMGIILLDESAVPEESPPASLLDRLAFILEVDAMGGVPEGTADDVRAARSLLPRVEVDDKALTALCATAGALGVTSLRATLLALRAARAAAALARRSVVEEADLTLAVVLVLAPRATRVPPAEAPPPDVEDDSTQSDPPAAETAEALTDVVLEAALASLPPDLLAKLTAEGRIRRGTSGRTGQTTRSHRRGRPTGIRAGPGLPGARLALVATLRAAVPWQALRRRDVTRSDARVLVRKSDFRWQHFKEQAGTTTIFVVDASGSAAVGRLAEAKGAVELLLAECYVRRDQVAAIGFRGSTAEVLLPPTMSLVRAKRALAALPGGGGTPLANALNLAQSMALAEQRRGRTPLVLLLTDGRANIARNGTAGRLQAETDALSAARALACLQMKALVVDTSPRPQPEARRIAEAMAARYLPLPAADSHRLLRAAKTLGVP